MRLLILAAFAAPLVAACSGDNGVPHIARGAFTSKDYGVKVSPRLSTAKNPPRGGGRAVVGKPYVVKGKTYTPVANPMGYAATGSASWYGNDFHGRQTANGEIFSANAISGAHPTLPLPSYVRVTNLDNGRSILVRVNDRGPYVHGRVMDLSYRAAAILGYSDKGVGNIQVNYVGPAPLNGDDTKMLLASVDRPTRMEAQTTRFAMVEEPAGGDADRVRFDSMSAEADGGRTLLSNITGLFGYADVDASVTGAHAAVEAMATRADALAEWVAVTDEDARDIRLELGVFADADRAEDVVLAFAMLGAVDEDAVRLPGADATRLTLTHLKPGVSRNDVMLRARELGLTGLVLY
ncbi:septal ring lytic transglycosylase RlpA family protein [Devosia sp.]|uniref:septal ring lytic transglycosylase RlpA family protein n=1 Tax=Devosia sp. TaxID=1871048 RepID=UPI003A8CC2F8